MKLYNSLTSSISQLNKTEINVYSCGPTVYNYIHIGNARPAILMDTLVRYLNHRQIKVNYLQNITDIDDKIIHKAIEMNVSEIEVAQKYTQAFLNDLKKLNVLPPTKMAPISEEMDRIINLIVDLVKTNDAYVVDGDVYFDIQKWVAKYGQLSGRKLDELISTDRVCDLKKRNPLDFSLWKKTDVGIKWDSPFGLGRPGWHTECVLLINDFFHGQTIDIHQGGIDLKFPHHENERIQFWAHNQQEIADLWMHNGHVTISGEKMSKSLGNFILVKDFVEDFSGNLLRWIFLTTNYKHPINITDDVIEQGIKFFDKLNNLRKKVIQELVEDKLVMTKLDLSKNLSINEFNQFMDDDLNTSRVLSLIERLIKDLNQTNDNQKINELTYLLEVLGFENPFDITLTMEDKKMMQTWKQLLAKKDFAQADLLREQLKAKGLI